MSVMKDEKGVKPPVRQELLDDIPALKVLHHYDPGYVEEIAKLLDAASRFSREKIRPNAMRIERLVTENPGFIDWDLVRAGAEHRFLSIIIPKELKGLGGFSLMGGLAIEELCAGCAGIAVIFGASLLGIAPIVMSCSLEHMDRYVYEIAEAEIKGEPIIAAFAITEPGAGTDAQEPSFLRHARIGTEARKVPGGYLLNGTKCFISNGSIARYITVFMPVDRSRPDSTWTCFVVDTRRQGFKVNRVEKKMGQRACPAAEISFDDYFVPEEDVVGGEGRGMQPLTLTVLAASRGPVGAIATGIARGAFERFVEWAETKRNGKKPASSELIQIEMADMKNKILASRAMYLEAAFSLDFGCSRKLMEHPLTKTTLKLPRSFRVSPWYLRVFRSKPVKNFMDWFVSNIMESEELTKSFALASAAKAFCSDIAVYVTSRCLELMGMEQTPLRAEIEKCFRDAKLTQIYEGTNELNRLSVYKSLFSGNLKIDFS